MKIVVIGGNGFIGSHFIPLAVDRGHTVIVCGRSVQPRIAHGRPYTMLSGGVAALLDDFDRYADADVICQFASSTIPASSNADPVNDIENNLVQNVRLLEAMRRSGCKRIIYLSSGGAIYGTPRYTPMDEDHPQNPISSYGVVKGAVERYLNLYSDLYGLSAAVIRPANPYGPGQDPKGQLGAVSVFLDLAQQGRPITLFGDGSAIRDFVYVGDLAQMIIDVVEQGATGAFNCGGGAGISLNGLVDLIERITGKPLERHYLPSRPFDPHSVVLDIRRAEERLGWTPTLSLDDGVRRTWDTLNSPGGMPERQG